MIKACATRVVLLFVVTTVVGIGGRQPTRAARAAQPQPTRAARATQPRPTRAHAAHPSIVTVLPPGRGRPRARGGTWRRTGSLADERTYQSATLLPDGTVLVVGGVQGRSDLLDSAERYDPARGVWRRAGSLPFGGGHVFTARAGHTATLLANGVVLVVGGAGHDGILLTDADLYDPRTGVWRPTGSLPAGHAAHTATLLPNGRVLVAGNDQGDGRSAEMYDPVTGTWSKTGGMAVARFAHTVTLLPNGRVLVIGGGSRRAELYDPATGRWTGAGSVDAEGSTAMLLRDGRVLIAGGCGRARRAASALYDPVTGRWTSTGRPRAARAGHTATLLSDGTVLVAGGQPCAGDAYLATAERFDPATGTGAPPGRWPNRGRGTQRHCCAMARSWSRAEST